MAKSGGTATVVHSTFKWHSNKIQSQTWTFLFVYRNIAYFIKCLIKIKQHLCKSIDQENGCYNSTDKLYNWSDQNTIMLKSYFSYLMACGCEKSNRDSLFMNEVTLLSSQLLLT